MVELCNVILIHIDAGLTPGLKLGLLVGLIGAGLVIGILITLFLVIVCLQKKCCQKKKVIEVSNNIAYETVDLSIVTTP